MLKNKTAKRAGFVIVAGDLAGFSTAHATGYPQDVEEYVWRYMLLTEAAIQAANGALIKFIGDGWLAAWVIPEDQNERSKLCATIHEMVFTLGILVRMSSLGITLDPQPYLRQGISVEPHGLAVSYERDKRKERDIFGPGVNLAFRLESIAKTFPNLVARGQFLKWCEVYPGNMWGKREITPEELKHNFKGVRSAELDDLYFYDVAEESWESKLGPYLDRRGGEMYKEAIEFPYLFTPDSMAAAAGFLADLSVLLGLMNTTSPGRAGEWLSGREWCCWIELRKAYLSARLKQMDY